jgi:hypothetical protein
MSGFIPIPSWEQLVMSAWSVEQSPWPTTSYEAIARDLARVVLVAHQRIEALDQQIAELQAEVAALSTSGA